METVFVIHIVQLGQYGTTSVNMDFFLVFADFVPGNINSL